LVVCCPKDLKKAVHCCYERSALSSSVKNVYQRLENLDVPISKLLDTIDLEVSGKNFLDLGTGWGVVAIAAARKFGDKSLVVGLDFSPACLRLAKEAIKEMELSDNVQFILGDAENLSLKDEVFDVVVSQATINLFPNKLKAFSEIARILKMRGALALSDAIKKEDIHEKSLDLWCQCVTGALTMKECKQIMKAYGLTLDHTEDLTATVQNLVKTGKWPWPEFLKFRLDYFVMRARKAISTQPDV